MTRGLLHRWLVVVMLAYAFGDLCSDSVSPQQCCEWMDNLTISHSADRGSIAGVSDAALSITAPVESEQESSVPSDTDEDCFCCCGHMLPAVHFNAPVIEVRACLASLTKTVLPAAHPQKKFNPPRLS